MSSFHRILVDGVPGRRRLIAGALALMLGAPAASAQTLPPSSSAPSGSTSAATDAGCRVVVLDLKSNGLPDGEGHLPRLLTEALADEVAGASSCTVMTQADVSAMMDLGAAQMACGAESDACLAEIGQALGADFLVTGAVGALGQKRIVAARLLDMKAGVVKQRAEEQRLDVADLDAATRLVGGRLFGATATTVAPTNSGPGPLFWTGGVLTGVGVVVAGTGGVIALLQEQTLNNAEVVTADKDSALGTGRLMLGVAAGGAALAAVGGVLMVLGSTSGEAP